MIDKIIQGDCLEVMPCTEALNELCLFAGAGGGLLGSKMLGWRTVCYVEKDPYCIGILKARIGEGYLCDAPIWDDIKTFDGKPWAGLVDIVTAGFPCQPFSVAGKRKGADDSRNMWPETIRVIREVRPHYAFCENVPGLIGGDHGYFGRILNDLSQSGYNARWRIISAADVGAPHLRKRLWILAYSREFRRRGWDYGDARWPGWTLQVERSCSRDQQASMADPQGGESREQEARNGWESFSGDGEISDANDARFGAERLAVHTSQEHIATQCRSWWDNDPAENATESQMGRVAHGVPDRMGQLRALGNAQVPGVARLAWILLIGAGE